MNETKSYEQAAAKAWRERVARSDMPVFDRVGVIRVPSASCRMARKTPSGRVWKWSTQDALPWSDIGAGARHPSIGVKATLRPT
jgi:hypothetical protein